MPFNTTISVVQQFYQSEVNNEYVIRGNAAILKCSIPSFVADFVSVVSWNDDVGNSYTLDEPHAKQFGVCYARVYLFYVRCALDCESNDISIVSHKPISRLNIIFAIFCSNHPL